ncbi:endoplasmic reticulum protein [Mycena olivaceomarginata]|nr:endoplasmic reticulum protein [Mycena olivaceomarginata]
MSKSLEYSTLESASKWLNPPPPPPPRFLKVHIVPDRCKDVRTPTRSIECDQKKHAMDFATAPAKSRPMQAFMLYMSGGGVQIFSMGSAKNPKALTTLILQKLVYVACNLLTLGVGLCKCRSTGLLPLGTGDWLAFETRGIAPEITLF